MVNKHKVMLSFLKYNYIFHIFVSSYYWYLSFSILFAHFKIFLIFLSLAWWCKPVVPATLEAEAGVLLEHRNWRPA
jgi:hypothetical protein